jgi:DNA-binding MurR/RpiR family transcriptional regulator
MTSLSPRERVLATIANLSPKQRQLAHFFLDHEDQVAFASVNEISEQAGASAATVVRYCQMLGYEGYTEFQAAVRAQFPQYRTGVQKLAERMASGGFTDHLPTQVAQVNTHNVQQTMSQVVEAEVARIVEAIIRAKRICIFGSGLSAAAAILLEHALIVLGYPARACINGGLNQEIELARLSDQDLVISISLWRYLRDTVGVVETAHARGVPCIALTDNPAAPIARLADHVLIAATNGVAHSRSLVGITSLVDMLSAALVIERPQASLAALQRMDDLYRQKKLLVSD